KLHFIRLPVGRATHGFDAATFDGGERTQGLRPRDAEPDKSQTNLGVRRGSTLWCLRGFHSLHAEDGCRVRHSTHVRVPRPCR
ncbi:hypothetical protein PUNSTDRAFT_144189, partial [Punctularia strigosozonata HHB-11173 SS5]|uniref:uncharacterized protein n=1 Tax=Punctularia strigosozonata (strain HHB-11173) TaxID=741275 RepID=UPI0004418386